MHLESLHKKVHLKVVKGSDAVWLAAILHCVTLEATTCDIMARVGGLFEDHSSCVRQVSIMGDLLSNNHIFVVTHCFKIQPVGEPV